MAPLRRSALSLTLLAVFGGLAAAQTPSATVVGRVVDPTSAVVHGATVRVRNVATNEVRTAQTQVDGNYTVAALPAGIYDVTFEKEGFKQLRQQDLELQIGQTARIDGMLQVGASAQ